MIPVSLGNIASVIRKILHNIQCVFGECSPLCPQNSKVVHALVFCIFFFSRQFCTGEFRYVGYILLSSILRKTGLGD